MLSFKTTARIVLSDILRFALLVLAIVIALALGVSLAIIGFPLGLLIVIALALWAAIYFIDPR
jgi:uncharacterized protein (DUF2062 family)